MFAAALDTLNTRRAQALKVYGFVENVVPSYSELDFKKDFRINKTTFDRLVMKLSPELQYLHQGYG